MKQTNNILTSNVVEDVALEELVVVVVMVVAAVGGGEGRSLTKKFLKLIQSPKSCDFVEFLFHSPNFQPSFFHYPPSLVSTRLWKRPRLSLSGATFSSLVPVPTSTGRIDVDSFPFKSKRFMPAFSHLRYLAHIFCRFVFIANGIVF